MTNSMRFTLAAGAVAIGYLGWTFASRNFSKPAAQKAPAAYQDVLGIDKLSSVTILHFYALPGVITDGDKATLCYGVAKAKAVRLEPAGETLSPSLNRCIQVAPARDTEYTLSAEGDDGRSVTAVLDVQVKPDPLTTPRVVYFVSQKKGEPRENLYSLCFAVENAVRVSVDPPVIPAMEGAPRGCFYVAPRQTTTYKLLVAGRQGRTAARELTIETAK
jgi:hypothetical protein